MVRIFQHPPLHEAEEITLDDNAFNHLIRALRLREGDAVTLFDGSNRILPAVISHLTKKSVSVKTGHFQEEDRESPLQIELGQVLSRGEKMEFTIQKAVELGVSRIVPLISTRCGVKLDAERLAKKVAQWQKIVYSACEQCGRNRVPEIADVMTLSDWCQQPRSYPKITLHPRAPHGLSQLTIDQPQLALLIGPEGGLTAEEIEMTVRHQFIEVQLGPRILRTETAALTTISALQALYGDLK